MTSSTSSSDDGGATPGPEAPLDDATRATGAGLPRVLAILLPLAIVAPMLLVLLDERPPLGNPRTAHLDDALAADPPDLLVVSNSLGGWGIDEQLLAELVGRGRPDAPRPSVHKLWEGGAGPVSFYAMLLRRVLARGQKPERVIFATRLDTLFARGVLSQTDTRAYLEHSPVPIDALERKLAHGGDTQRILARLGRNRVALGEGLIGLVKDSAAGLVFGEDLGQGLLRAGREVAGPALDVVLSAPAALPEDAGSLPMMTLRPDPLAATLAETFVPDLLALCAAHDVHATFVLMPVTRRAAAEAGVDAQREDAFFAAVAGFGDGADVIDLRAASLPQSVFWDAQHLDPWGRALLTADLARALCEVPSLADLVGKSLVPHRAPPRDLLPDAKAHGGSHSVTRATPLARVVLTDLRAEPLRPDSAVASLGRLAALADDRIALRARHALCSPLVFFEDDRPLQPFAIARQSASWQPATGGVLITSSDGSAPLAGIHTYATSLAADRRCVPLSRWWIYPGDRARITLAHAELLASTRRLRVRGDVFEVGGDPDAVLNVRLVVDGVTVVDLQRPALELGRGGLGLSLAASVPRETHELVLELELPVDGPLVLLGSVLALE